MTAEPAAGKVTRGAERQTVTAPDPSAAPGAALVPCPGPGRPRRHPFRRLLTVALTVLIVAGVFGFALPRFASYGAVWQSLAGVQWPGLLFIGGTLVVNQVATWTTLTATLPSLRLRQAAAVNLGSTAVANTVPAGGALSMGVSWAMLSSWGTTASAFCRYTLVSGLWNVFIRLGVPVIALALLAATSGTRSAPQGAAYAGAGLLVILTAGLWALLRSERVAVRAGKVVARAVTGSCRLARRQPPARAAELLPEFRASTLELVTGRWLRITVTTLASHLSLWLVLLACLRSLGVTGAQVSVAASLFAFAFSRLLSVLPITPGGVGVVELGLTGTMAAGLGPAAAARVAAAVLLYRALTYLLAVPLGAVAYVWWRWQGRGGAAARPAQARERPARGAQRQARLPRIVIAPDQAD